MAITLHESPDLYTPVYNPMRFVISSTNSGQTNFRYVVDVYTSGVSGYTRLLFPPDPTTGYAAPYIQGVIESQISYDLSDTTYGFQQCTNSLKAYEVKFGEQYGDSVTTFPMLAVTGTKYAWNGVFSPPVFSNFDYTLYTVGMGGACLTNQPENLYFSETTTENAWLYFINDTSGTCYYGKVKTYDQNNNLLGTYNYENSYQASSSVSQKLLRFACGTEDLNSASLWGVVISSSVYKYTVEFTTFAGVTTSQVYTFNRECQWKGFEPVTLRWLNRLGGFDSFNFRLARRYSSTTERDTFQKNLGTLSGTSWSYTKQDRGTTVYNTKVGDKLLADSDWITTGQSEWLQELFESPEVYYYNGSDMIPVTVSQTGYEKKNIKIDKMFNVQIEVVYANPRWTQSV